MIGSPNEVFDEFSQKSINVKQYCYIEDQNGKNRFHMEDKHLINDTIFEDIGFYSVYDGHGGKQAVTYCVNRVEQLFKEKYQQNKNDIKNLFWDIFKQVDNEMAKDFEQYEDQGTCCCVIIIAEGMCHVINVGDTRALLCYDNGTAERVSVDHKANSQEEVNRIQNMGGIIMRGRVSGVLAVSRALGDINLKNEGVICEPFIKSFQITEDKKFLVVASDGLWDVCPDENEVCKMIYRMESSLEQAEFLKDYALQQNSLDNIAIMVLWL